MGGSGRRMLATALVVSLGAVAPGLCGMAELGRNGSDTSSGGGKVKLEVNPPFIRNVNSGDTVTQILADLANQVNAHPQQAWTAAHTPGTNVISVVRKDGQAINIHLQVEGTSFPESTADTGFDRVRVDRGPGGTEFSSGTPLGVGRIDRTDEPAGDGSVTVTVNGVAVGVGTAGHDSGSLLVAIAAALQGAGFPDAAADSAAVRVPGVYDVIFEETDSGIDSFGVGIEENFRVPTLSEWGVMALILLTGTAAMWQIGRRTGGVRIRAR